MLESNLGNHKNLFPHIGNHQYPIATDNRNHAQTIAMSFNFSSLKLSAFQSPYTQGV